jgi:hypothetical protein
VNEVNTFHSFEGGDGSAKKPSQVKQKVNSKTRFHESFTTFRTNQIKELEKISSSKRESNGVEGVVVHPLRVSLKNEPVE